MARSKEFDPDEALDKAMCLFWRKGYLDTSIEDLVTETGVSRYGLYGTFGDKRALFFAALHRYRDCVVSMLLSGLEQPDASLAEIRAYFAFLLENADTPPGNNGCLIVNTGAELASDDAAAAEEVHAHIDRLKRVFSRALENAVAGGELDDSFDVSRHADFLVGVVYGTASLARAKADRDALSRYVDVALATIR